METPLSTTTAITTTATSASDNEASLPASGSSLENVASPTMGDATTVTVVAGLVVMVAWWLCGRRCHRGSDLPRRFIPGVEKEELYEFLSDPHCMTVVHPLASAVRMEEETGLPGGVGATTKRFILVEKVPFTVESEAVMRCDPSTNTIVTVFKPVGGLFTVQVTWRCSDATDSKPGPDCDCAASNSSRQGVSRSTRPSHQQTSTSSSPAQPGHQKDGSESAPDSREVDRGSNSSDSTEAAGQGTPSTVFENHVLVIGPRVVAILVAHRVKTLQIKLTDNLQQYFLNHKAADE